jgi:uncharacterized protein with PQ loop repeat
MNNIVTNIGVVAVTLAVLLDTWSYWKQIAKTIKTKKSAQVSSSQYLYKIAKALCALLGLAIYSNWVGVGIETVMLVVYIISLVVVAKYKPKDWKLLGK